MLFDNWSGIIRVLILGASSYMALIAILRLSGKRTLAQMNAFDFVVTVAFGSTLATILLSSDVALAEGVTAFIVLVVLQYLIAALSVRFRWMEDLAKAQARALLIDGVFDRSAMRQERVTGEEVMAAIRSAGLGDISDVAAVVLETDGSFSVIARKHAGARSAFPAAERAK